jgi:uncharacterized protein (TIGR03435 family)
MFTKSGAANCGAKILLMAAMLAAPIAAFGQAAEARLEFDVATVKASAPLDPAAIAQGKMPRFGTNVQGTRVDIGNAALSELIAQAYKVKPYQVSGPDWMKTTRFDIQAKMPDDSNKDQVPEMLQSLLAERFGMKIHKEQREDSIYALVVAKGGHKLKESPPDTELPAEPRPGAIALPNGGGQVKVDRNGSATINAGERGNIKMGMTPEGKMHMEFSKATMEIFAQQLTPLVDHPVFDLTELKGNFQVALDLPMETLLSLARAQGMNIPVLPGARGGGPGGGVEASDPGSTNAIFASVQQLGLRLEPRKMPVDFIVVDHAEKTPTEN